MLSRLAREFAAEIAQHDWSDAPYRMDRAGHQREHDSNRGAEVLDDRQVRALKTNVVWVTAQVLGHAQPDLDLAEYAKACGIDLKSTGWLWAGVRHNAGHWMKPGTYDYDEEQAPN